MIFKRLDLFMTLFDSSVPFSMQIKNLALAEQRAVLESELSEEWAKYRDLVIRSEIEKKQLETRSEVDRRILDYLTSGKQQGLRDALINAASNDEK